MPGTTKRHIDNPAARRARVRCRWLVIALAPVVDGDVNLDEAMRAGLAGAHVVAAGDAGGVAGDEIADPFDLRGGQPLVEEVAGLLDLGDEAVR